MRLKSDWARHFVTVPLVSIKTNLDPQQDVGDCPQIHGRNSPDRLQEKNTALNLLSGLPMMLCLRQPRSHNMRLRGLEEKQEA